VAFQVEAGTGSTFLTAHFLMTRTPSKVAQSTCTKLQRPKVECPLLTIKAILD
jgi:hypothetical protein